MERSEIRQRCPHSVALQTGYKAFEEFDNEQG
jgi:hypothetical protein